MTNLQAEALDVEGLDRLKAFASGLTNPTFANIPAVVGEKGRRALSADLTALLSERETLVKERDEAVASMHRFWGMLGHPATDPIHDALLTAERQCEAMRAALETCRDVIENMAPYFGEGSMGRADAELGVETANAALQPPAEETKP